MHFPRHLPLALLLSLTPATFAQSTPTPPAHPHNILIFVADGMRHGSVDPATTPTMAAIRKSGVDFTNSHSLFPTFTTPNASAIATGHYLGDTGDFGNSLFLGPPSLNPADPWAVIHNVESDTVLPAMNSHFSDNYLGEESLLAAARNAGFNTAAIGKIGPTLIQDVTRNNPGITPDNIQTILIDDQTGRVNARGQRLGVPLLKPIADRILNDSYFQTTYFRLSSATPVGPFAEPVTPAAKVVNTPQQRYLADVATRIVLPSFIAPSGTQGHKPFAMVFWSRDPDVTQHNNVESLDKIVPGINNETVKRGLRNADDTLKQLLEYLKATPDPNEPGKNLSDTTNLFITSDHGFGTLSKQALDAAGTPCVTFATQQRYRNIPEGTLPPGFISIDLAHDLNLPLFDADAIDTTASIPGAQIAYRKLRIESTDTTLAQFPTGGAGLIGGGIFDKDGFSAQIITTDNLIYLPAQMTRENGAALMRKIVASFITKPYISGLFIDTDRFGEIPGTLALADIGLRGAARTPVPAMVINFKSFSTDPQNPEITGVEIADTTLRQGQGMHGSFGRHVTYNNMMAIGPDFKTNLTDTDPVSNADIVTTLSHISGIDMLAKARGTLHGRVTTEALAKGPAPKGSERKRKESVPAENGAVTTLLYQIYTDEAGHPYPYFDAGGFPGATVGLPK